MQLLFFNHLLYPRQARIHYLFNGFPSNGGNVDAGRASRLFNCSSSLFEKKYYFD